MQKERMMNKSERLKHLLYNEFQIDISKKAICYLKIEVRKIILEAFSYSVENEWEWKWFYNSYYDSEFFEGMGAFYGCTDGEFGMEWLKRKVKSMKKKIQKKETCICFDVFEEDVFFQLLTWVRSCQKEKFKYKMCELQKTHEREIMQSLTERYNIEKELANILARAISNCWSAECNEEDPNLYFQGFDYFVFFEEGFANGLLKLRDSVDVEYGYDYVICMFEEAGLKAPMQLLRKNEYVYKEA